LSQPDGTPPAVTAPHGTAQRIRTRAIWAVALFASSLPPAAIGVGIATTTADLANAALPIAFLFWLIGLLFAIWAAVPTLRHWDGLPGQIRWLGALPLLSVSLFLSAAVIGVLIP
jgi:hypothetical protein